MIYNTAVRSVVLPCSQRTNVQNRDNWLYDLASPAPGQPEPMDIPEQVNEDGQTDDEFNQREWASLMCENPPDYSPHIHVSPAHTTPFVSDHFVGTSSGVTHASLDDILSEICAQSAMDAERDSMINATHQEQIEMMQYMRQMQTSFRKQSQ